MPISYRAAQSLIKKDDEAALRKALDEGLDANAVNENGWTLLMLAAVEGAAPVGRTLLDHGADPSLRNAKGDTAVTIATHRGYQVFIDLLSEPRASTT